MGEFGRIYPGITRVATVQCFFRWYTMHACLIPIHHWNACISKSLVYWIVTEICYSLSTAIHGMFILTINVFMVCKLLLPFYTDVPYSCAHLYLVTPCIPLVLLLAAVYTFCLALCIHFSSLCHDYRYHPTKQVMHVYSNDTLYTPLTTLVSSTF